MDRVKNVGSLILLLLPLCFLSAVVAFLLPTHGVVFSCITVILALAIAMLCVNGLFHIRRDV